MAEEFETTEQVGHEEPVFEPAPPITDRFLFVDVAAMRAKQLRRGALSRLGQHGEASGHLPIKAERIAMEEVRRGLVHYEVPEPKPRVTEPRV